MLCDIVQMTSSCMYSCSPASPRSSLARRTAVYTLSNDAVISSKQSHVVIVSHGWSGQSFSPMLMCAAPLAKWRPWKATIYGDRA